MVVGEARSDCWRAASSGEVPRTRPRERGWLIPDDPNAIGAVVYTQAAILDPTANALGLTTTNARSRMLGGWQ